MADSTYSSELQTALALSEKAANVSLQYFTGALQIETKADASPVTIADRATEQHLREALAQHFPDDGIFGEEFGLSDPQRDRIWVIDPIDGTRSFIAGVPLFGLLLALVESGSPRLGIVRLPALGQVYAGEKGGRATLDGRQIQCSRVQRLDDAMLFINEPERLMQSSPAQFDRLLKAGKLRRLSYDCQPHALVAAGNIDAVVDTGLQPYDYMALVPLIEAAGGVISDWSGRALDFNSDGRIVTAATPLLHDALLDLLA